MTRVLWVVGVMAACSVCVDAHGSLVIPPARNNYRQKDPANITGNSHMDQVRVDVHPHCCCTRHTQVTLHSYVHAYWCVPRST